MAKIQVKFCKKCGEYTKHSYVGKLKEPEDHAFNCFATMMTLGMYQISKRIMDDSPKCFECNKCGHILKDQYESIPF